MALALTTFLQRGTSEVSVSFLWSSSSSSGVILAAFCCSRPQKHITAFLHKPGSSSGSVVEKTKGDEENRLCALEKAHICIFKHVWYGISVDYHLSPCWNLGYQSSHPVRGLPSPQCSSSGSNKVDTTAQNNTAHGLKPIIHEVGYCGVF